MQFKYSMKKEWALFTRTSKLLGVVITLVAITLSNPLLFKFSSMVFNELGETAPQLLGSMLLAEQTSASDLLAGMDFSDMAALFNDAGIMYSSTMQSTLGMGALIIMILFIAPAGGEQQKRAMIVPLCSGLDTKSYLLAKFIIYPISVFIMTFITSIFTAIICNAMFPDKHLTVGITLLMSLLSAVYMMFLISIFLSLGLCTSHPGFMAAIVFAGTSILQTVSRAAGLVKYQPFTLYMLVCGGITADPDFVLEENASNIAISIAIALLVCVLMYFLALGVINAKKINNREEITPEF